VEWKNVFNNQCTVFCRTREVFHPY
jgi:hypothetical protein